jgi:long-chain acyl-CoA synthetase
VSGAELRLVTPDGTDAAPGEIGEGYTRGNAQMLGYWGESELTEQVIGAQGWYRTRDYLRLDEDGYLYVTGRVSDMIVRGGANVSPVEVEAKRCSHNIRTSSTPPSSDCPMPSMGSESPPR